MAVGQEGEGRPGGGVAVVDEGEDGDGIIEPLLLDQTVDGAGVLPVLDVELVHVSPRGLCHRNVRSSHHH